MMISNLSAPSSGRRRKLTIHCGHDEPDLSRISGTCEVGIDLLLLGLVERHETVENVVASSRVVRTALIIREVVLHRADRQLLLESVDLVEEENDGRLDEPPRVADRVEQGKRFLHTVDRLVFKQELVVFGNGDKEENRGHVLEAVNPLLPLRPLTTHVEHPVRQVADDKGSFRNTGSLDTRAEDILVSGEIVGLGDALNAIKVACSVSLIQVYIT